MCWPSFSAVTKRLDGTGFEGGGRGGRSSEALEASSGAEDAVTTESEVAAGAVGPEKRVI